jgi:hypothetical protein
MIGCFAEGISEEIKIDYKENENVSWFSVEEISNAIENSEKFVEEARAVGGVHLLASNSSIFRLPPRSAVAFQILRQFIVEKFTPKK